MYIDVKNSSIFTIDIDERDGYGDDYDNDIAEF